MRIAIRSIPRATDSQASNCRRTAAADDMAGRTASSSHALRVRHRQAHQAGRQPTFHVNPLVGRNCVGSVPGAGLLLSTYWGFPGGALRASTFLEKNIAPDGGPCRHDTCSPAPPRPAACRRVASHPILSRYMDTVTARRRVCKGERRHHHVMSVTDDSLPCRPSSAAPNLCTPLKPRQNNNERASSISEE